MASGDPNSIQIPQPVAPANGNVPAPGTFTPQAATAPVSTGEGVDVSSQGAKPLFDMSNARPIGQPKPLDRKSVV